ncbi:ABC transporter substrate-binding protein [bacterium]|nr:ABC transporter substrate-binding protein [bacterium]MBU1991019.1 ABC transporter substrate-binding protein [bacterium]
MKTILLLLFLSVSLFASQKVVLQLSWLHQFQFGGYYIAKERGYYKERAIDVEFKEFTYGTDLSGVIEKKEADFAIGRSSLLIDRIEGKDIVALGAIFQVSPLMLLVRDDSNISSVSDLKGKRIMLTDDARGTASIMAMLFSKGITQKDVHILPHSFNLDDLINRNTDAMASYVSNEPIRLEDMGVGYKIFDPKDYGFQFYGDILFGSSEFIKHNPKLTKDFYEATLRGWEYAFEHISETAELIYRKYNTQNKTLLQLIKEGESLKRLAYHANGTIGYLDCEQLDDIVNVYKLLGIVSEDLDVESFIYEKNHPAELAFTLNYDELFHLAMISVLVIVSIGFGVLLLSFRKQWLLTKNDMNKKISDQKNEIDKQNRVIMAQSKMAAVGSMLSNIAHQWRQPLNIISLNIAKMETSLLLGKDVNVADISAMSREINRQSQYLSQTIDDFKNYFNSNIKNMTEFTIEDSIVKVNELTKELYKNNSIELVMSSMECSIVQNESLLIQALLNIYNNAKDAMVETNTKYRCFFVEIFCDDEKIVLSLRDSGGGINEDIIGRIFEPYYSTKGQAAGTGLGLYISYEIVTKHFHGSIEVRNKEYVYKGHKLRGAEFEITIPIIQKGKVYES